MKKEWFGIEGASGVHKEAGRKVAFICESVALKEHCVAFLVERAQLGLRVQRCFQPVLWVAFNCTVA